MEPRAQYDKGLTEIEFVTPSWSGITITFRLKERFAPIQGYTVVD